MLNVFENMKRKSQDFAYAKETARFENTES